MQYEKVTNLVIFYIQYKYSSKVRINLTIKYIEMPKLRYLTP